MLMAKEADGEGSHPVKFELVRQDLESEEVILAFDLPPIHMTHGRFFVLNRGYKLTHVVFPAAGINEFRILCVNNVGADEIRLEEVT
jgi:hypothetical protein